MKLCFGCSKTKKRQEEIIKETINGHLGSSLFTLGLYVMDCLYPAGEGTPRLYYCGTPQDRNERGGGGRGGGGRRVKNYSEQHRSKRLHKQRREAETHIAALLNNETVHISHAKTVKHVASEEWRGRKEGDRIRLN